MLYAYRTDHLRRSLEGLFQNSSHIKIFGEQEDVWHKVFSSFWCRKRGCEFFVFEKNGSEDISQFMNGECLSKYHFIEGLRHASKHDFVSAHQ